MFSCGVLRTAVLTAAVSIIAYPALAGAGFEGRALATAAPPVTAGSPSPGPGDRAGGGGPLVTRPPDDVERTRIAPGSDENSLPIGVPLLLVILAAGGIIVALVTGRKRGELLAPVPLDAVPALSAGGPPPGGDRVRVVPGGESGPRVTVREAHRSLTNVVRLEPHSGVPMVEVEERG